MTEQRFIAASTIRAEVEKFADDVLAEAIGQAIGQIVNERFAEVNAKLARLEASMAEFRFVPWSEGKDFRAGNFTSVGGALFHCSADTKAKPGNGSADWYLVAARGRDGKDYVPPERPAARVVRSAR